MQATSKQGQWLGDIAVQESGSLESIFELAQRSNLSVTGVLTAGTLLEFPGPIDKRVISYYRQNNIIPATDDPSMVTPGGIGYMGIGINFIVS